ncbi:MAG: DUF1338 domain-containing protein [Myxococcales bacterium]|nr:DUF1338 domain-containing protein [Myxococcales bacterium]
MSDRIDALFHQLWQQYVAVTPSALGVHQLLGASPQQVLINDHVALRTFNAAPIQLERLAQVLVSVGYKKGGDYFFSAKKVRAEHYEHQDPTRPKIFISELIVDEFSTPIQAIIGGLVEQVDALLVDDPKVLYSGRLWDISFADYQKLLKESEYAGWLAAWGFRANHFTVSVNHLQAISSLQEVNQKLVAAGYRLNTLGGAIKGSPGVLLEQSSLMADRQLVTFLDGDYEIPSCFCEFARRYRDKDGSYFAGFIENSADKIFQSTDSRNGV